MEFVMRRFAPGHKKEIQQILRSTSGYAQDDSVHTGLMAEHVEWKGRAETASYRVVRMTDRDSDSA